MLAASSVSIPFILPLQGGLRGTEKGVPLPPFLWRAAWQSVCSARDASLSPARQAPPGPWLRRAGRRGAGPPLPASTLTHCPVIFRCPHPPADRLPVLGRGREPTLLPTVLPSIPSPGDLPVPGIKPRSLALEADPLPSELPGNTCKWLLTLKR